LAPSGEPIFRVIARISVEAMMLRLLVGVLTAFVISSVAFAQTSTVPAMPKQYQDMAAAMAAAQAKAVRPGDEALGCAAIEKELMTSMNDPAVQSYAAKAAAAAQLPPGTLGRGATTPQAAAAMAAALSSNAAIARSMASMGTTMTPQQIQAMQALAVQQAQALSTPQAQAALQAQALAAQHALANPQVQAALQAQLQEPAAQLAMMTTVMPQMMRSQRLVGLALAKGCPSLGAVPVIPPAKR
jgi:hypothetical protein